MNALDVSKWHPGCGVVCIPANNDVILWCPTHRQLARASAVGFEIAVPDSFITEPGTPRRIVAQPTKGIPSSEVK